MLCLVCRAFFARGGKGRLEPTSWVGQRHPQSSTIAAVDPLIYFVPDTYTLSLILRIYIYDTQLQQVRRHVSLII